MAMHKRTRLDLAIEAAHADMEVLVKPLQEQQAAIHVDMTGDVGHAHAAHLVAVQRATPRVPPGGSAYAETCRAVDQILQQRRARKSC